MKKNKFIAIFLINAFFITSLKLPAYSEDFSDRIAGEIKPASRGEMIDYVSNTFHVSTEAAKQWLNVDSRYAGAIGDGLTIMKTADQIINKDYKGAASTVGKAAFKKALKSNYVAGKIASKFGAGAGEAFKIAGGHIATGMLAYEAYKLALDTTEKYVFRPYLEENVYQMYKDARDHGEEIDMALDQVPHWKEHLYAKAVEAVKEKDIKHNLSTQEIQNRAHELLVSFFEERYQLDVSIREAQQAKEEAQKTLEKVNIAADNRRIEAEVAKEAARERARQAKLAAQKLAAQKAQAQREKEQQEKAEREKLEREKLEKERLLKEAQKLAQEANSLSDSLDKTQQQFRGTGRHVTLEELKSVLGNPNISNEEKIGLAEDFDRERNPQLYTWEATGIEPPLDGDAQSAPILSPQEYQAQVIQQQQSQQQALQTMAAISAIFGAYFSGLSKKPPRARRLFRDSPTCPGH